MRSRLLRLSRRLLRSGPAESAVSAIDQRAARLINDQLGEFGSVLGAAAEAEMSYRRGLAEVRLESALQVDVAMLFNGEWLVRQH